MSAERAWHEATLDGFLAMAAGRRAAAAGAWIGALDLLDEADPSDPRRAAGQSNAGVGNLLLGRNDRAGELLGAAERAWARVAGLIETVEVPVVGMSSSHHFRLASQNLAVFEAIRRKRLAQLCEASLAVTRFNRLLAAERPPSRAVVEESAQRLAHVLCDVLGPNAPEVRLLSHPGPAPADEPYGEKAATFARRKPTLSDALSDACRTLETAFALTVLLGLPQASRVLRLS